MDESLLDHLRYIVDPESEYVDEATQAIIEFRDADFQQFVQLSINFLNSIDQASIRALLMIILTQYIRENPKIILNMLQQYIEQIINISFSLFSDLNEMVRINASYLYHSIAKSYIEISNDHQLLDNLIIQLEEPVSPSIQAVCCSINEFKNNIPEEMVTRIIHLLVNIFDSNYSIDIVIPSLGLFSVMLDEIIPIIVDQSNSLIIFNHLFHFLRNEQTKSISLKCFSSIALHYYQVLEEAIDQITSNSFIESISHDDTYESKIHYCSFWESIAQHEQNEPTSLHILKSCSPQVIIQLFSLMVESPPSTVNDIGEKYEPYIVATETVFKIFHVSVEESFNVLVDLFESNINSPAYNHREAALSCLSFVMRCEIIESSFEIIKTALNDESPRVRENAVFCAESYIETCGFNENSKYIIKIMLDKFNYDFDIIDSICTVLEQIISSKYPLISETIDILLHYAVSTGNSSAYQTLGNILSCLNSDFLIEMANFLLKSLESDHSHISKCSYLIVKIFYQLEDKLVEYVDDYWYKLSNLFGISPIDVLIPISVLGEKAGEKFQNYIIPTIEQILQILQSDEYERGYWCLKRLLKTFDLSSIGSKLLHLMLNPIADCGLLMQDKQQSIECVDILMRKNPELFIESVNEVFPILFGLFDNISISTDDYVLCFLLHLVTTIINIGLFPNEVKQTGLDIIFQILGLVSNSSASLDLILDEIANTLVVLLQNYKDILLEFLESCPSFELVISSITLHSDSKNVPYVIDLIQ